LAVRREACVPAALGERVRVHRPRDARRPPLRGVDPLLCLRKTRDQRTRRFRQIRASRPRRARGPPAANR
jgi:hypothetical protein